ncbi:MAG: hypothetical protein HY763_07930 [Planctomycetes bacterium]|nr:hypothetical protein [Planctomycetota bacterium]
MGTAKFILAWGSLVACGFAWLVGYSATAGTGDHTGTAWPADSQLARQAGRPALLVFLHPSCPCSRATVEELSRLLTQVGREVAATVVMVRPDGFEPGDEHTAVWHSVARLPGVALVVDPGGGEARRFGAATSGCTLLYDAEGRLVFHGGITAARGHEGDNAGKSAILSWLSGAAAEPQETPVFGCPLFDG